MPIRWQCPEAVATRMYTSKSDVYSFGVLLYEVFSGGATPYGDLANAEVLPMVRAGHRLQRPSHDTPDDVVALMRACTAAAPGERPSMAAVRKRLAGRAGAAATAWAASGSGGAMAVNHRLLLPGSGAGGEEGSGGEGDDGGPIDHGTESAL